MGGAHFCPSDHVTVACGTLEDTETIRADRVHEATTAREHVDVANTQQRPVVPPYTISPDPAGHDAEAVVLGLEAAAEHEAVSGIVLVTGKGRDCR
jgi:hypothetical protein